ncbi:DUF885 domain-containing protein [Erythrobacter crassostreae]|uniref:DUF885 domain-containing protein n=1 Tax=Erythrobacter crassostreae TaxID=2828328 RepID=A0A9X1F4Z3_9SPHN|nr:DUF885 domain-containing protein [Erythrobacter crassostrea]MBV7259428.1 DUF885 domain-containing protein [Erythrobacter crassostrea]
MTDTNFTLTRRHALKGLGGVSALALIPGCSDMLGNSAPALAPDAMLEKIGYDMLEHEPGRATGLGVDTGDYAAWRGTFGTPGAEGREKYKATLTRLRDEARDYPKDSLTPDQQVGFDVVESAFDKAVEGMNLPYGEVAVGSWRNAPYSVIQNVGSYIDMPRFFGSTQPVRSEEDVGFYLSRLGEVQGILDAETETMKATRAHGVIPPDFLLDKTIAQMESNIADAANNGGAYTAPLAASDVGAANEATDQAAQLVNDGLLPALQRQLEELKSQRAEAKSDAGMWAQPDGDEWYAWSTSASTTTSLSPDEIHQQGLDELDELHGRMDPILQEIGYTSGTVGERMQALGDDPRYKFAAGDPGRQEIFDFIDERIEWIKAQMPRAFNELVDPNMEVVRIPINEEAGAPGAYGGAGSKDGKIPGRFWINLRDTELHRKYDLADLTYHESIPGHVWEGEYSNRLPLIRSILAFGAFSEGWALYGEQLADELGAYDDFKVGKLGYLQSLAFRACRLVVDTGLHSKRWTREQANQFFIERNGSKAEEVAGEVDRYCSWPGQACSYKIGHSEIVRQRARAEAELGDAYDFKAFNTAVILGGNAPLDVVDKTVSRYIAGAVA